MNLVSSMLGFNATGSTPLHCLIGMGVAAARELAETAPSKWFAQEDDAGNLPLHNLLEPGSLMTHEFIEVAKIVIHRTPRESLCALSSEGKSMALLAASGAGCAALLCSFPPEALLVESKGESSCFHFVLTTGRCSLALLQHFVDSGGDINTLFELFRDDSDGNGLLHYVSRCGFGSVFQYLVGHAPAHDLTLVSNNGNTPLHLAMGSYIGPLDGTLTLIERIDRVDALVHQNNVGSTPLHVASQSGVALALMKRLPREAFFIEDDEGRIPVGRLLRFSDVVVAMLEMFAREETFMLHRDGQGIPLLLRMIEYAHIDAVKIVLEVSDTEWLLAQSYDGYNAVHCAASRLAKLDRHAAPQYVTRVERVLEMVASTVPSHYLYAESINGDTPASILAAVGKEYSFLSKPVKSAAH